MGFKTGTDRAEALLFPPCIDEYISADNAVRVIDAFVERLSLKELGLEERKDKKRNGANAYDPKALMKLYIYGYSNRIRSSREMEKGTHRNLEVIWLMNDLRPDHWTINEFRKKHPEVLKHLFRDFHLICKGLGLIGGKLVVVDSAFFKGSVNRANIYTTERLEKSLEKLNKSIDEHMSRLSAAENEDAAAASAPRPAPADIEAAMQDLKAKREALEELKKAAQASPTGQVSPVDPDSRLLRKGGEYVGGYQVQTAVDSKSHMIVAEHTMSGGTDSSELVPMAQRSQEALESDALKVVADGGYYSEEGLEGCENLDGVEVHMPVKAERGTKKNLYSSERFELNADKDVVICPQGHELARHADSRPKGDDRLYQVYYNTQACASCPVRARCTEGKYRKVHISVRKPLVDTLKQRLKDQPEVYARRAPTVEHPFGTMKFWMQGNALMTRGLKKVGGEISLTCLAYNLKRAIKMLGVAELVRYLQRTPQTAATS